MAAESCILLVLQPFLGGFGLAYGLVAAHSRVNLLVLRSSATRASRTVPHLTTLLKAERAAVVVGGFLFGWSIICFLRFTSSKRMRVFLMIVDITATGVVCASFVIRTLYLSLSTAQCKNALTRRVSDGKRGQKSQFEVVSDLRMSESSDLALDPRRPRLTVGDLAHAICRDRMILMVLEPFVLIIMVTISLLGIACLLSKSTRYWPKDPELDHTFLGHCPSCWHGRWIWRAAHDRFIRVVHRSKSKAGGTGDSRTYEMSSALQQKDSSTTVTRSPEAFALSKSRLMHLLSAYPFVVGLAERSHHADILNLALTCRDVRQTVLGCTRNDVRYIIGKTCSGTLTAACFHCRIKVCQECAAVTGTRNDVYWNRFIPGLHRCDPFCSKCFSSRDTRGPIRRYHTYCKCPKAGHILCSRCAARILDDGSSPARDPTPPSGRVCAKCGISKPGIRWWRCNTCRRECPDKRAIWRV